MIRTINIAAIATLQEKFIVCRFLAKYPTVMSRKTDLAEREYSLLEFDSEEERENSRPKSRRRNKREWYDERPGKDIWDKTAAIAPIISGGLIFAMGGICTYNYNQQQLRLQEIQTIEKFIPHLMGNEQSKRAAILAISSLTNAELAGKFAQIFASRGTVSALQSIAENGSDKEKNIAADALASALEKTRTSRASDDAVTEVPEGEVDKLERLAELCRARGHLAASETLLKQAVALRAKEGTDELSALKKLAVVQQAMGSKDIELTQKRISILTEGENQNLSQSQNLNPGLNQNSPPPPPAAPVKQDEALPKLEKTEIKEIQALPGQVHEQVELKPEMSDEH